MTRAQPMPGLAPAWPLRLATAALAVATCGAAAAADSAAGGPPELRVCADPSNLPYSNEQGEGFENRIAQIVAGDLHARVTYAWNMQRRGFLRRTLNARACDLVLDVPAGLEGVTALRPLWTSSYVFVTRKDAPVHPRDFDDPALRTLRIGLQAVGSEGANTPPAASLALRGLADHVVGYSMWATEDVASPVAALIDAVARREIDTAVVWGPFAGYFARQHGDALEVIPVTSDPRLPAMAYTYAMAPGVRRGDDAWGQRVQAALDRHADEIRALLVQYGVPLVSAPAVVASAEP